MDVPGSRADPTGDDRAGSSVWGAYGLRVLGLEAPGDQLGLVPLDATDGCPELRLAWAPAVPARRPSRSHLDDRSAALLLVEGGYVEITRRPSTAVVHTSRPTTEPDLVHPYLAGPAGIVAHWNGWMALHAGAMAIGDGTWAFLGGKEAGKTTTLAALTDLGHAVVTDDLLVLDGLTVKPGPRALDLRPDAARRRHQRGVVVRDGERWRVRVPAMASAGVPPLKGWFVLDAGDELQLEPVPLPERLARVREALATTPTDGEAVLDLLSLPMWRLRRPVTWAHLGASVEAVLGAVASAS
jgi:hypothetical protein